MGPICLYFVCHSTLLIDPPPCPHRRVPGVQFGSEDIHVMADGKAFISSGLLLSHGMKEYTEKHKLTGGMFLFDFKNSSVGAVELRIRADKPGKSSQISTKQKSLTASNRLIV